MKELREDIGLVVDIKGRKEKKEKMLK